MPQFKIKKKYPSGARLGKIATSGGTIETPAFFPIVNFITGPPGIFRNGGIWRHIKIDVLKRQKRSHFMSQILHFTDFNVSPNILNQWFHDGKHNITLRDRIIEAMPSPKQHGLNLFADSGGFKLLFNREYDLSGYDFDATPDGILKLQAKFGANLIATLDYPFHPQMLVSEKKGRAKKSVDNAIFTLTQLDRVFPNSNTRPFPYLPIHGHDQREVKEFTSQLLKRIEAIEYEEPFGLAVGSLVPIKNSSTRILDVIFGLNAAIRESKIFHLDEIPIHVFGITGGLIPILAYTGVDSFDSATYVQSAINLKFIFDGGKTSNIFDMKRLECNCKYCRKLDEIGLKESKKIIKSKPCIKHRAGSKQVYKSEIYALIALHNLRRFDKMMDGVLTTMQYADGDTLSDEISCLTYRSNKWRKLIQLIEQNIVSPVEPQIVKRSIPKKFERYKQISFRHKPAHFNINQKPFVTKKCPIMLILQCSKEKPYFQSRINKILFDELKNNDITPNLIQKVTLSGMYGPVPEQFEKEDPIIKYDYILTPQAKKRIELLKNRTINFLETHGKGFDVIVGYATTKAYRNVLEKVRKESSMNLILLPSSVRKAYSKEMTRSENIRDLLNVLKKYT
jgi:tRNA-guanine family transglycosylase